MCISFKNALIFPGFRAVVLPNLGIQGVALNRTSAHL